MLKKYGIYLFRWQLSTPILAVVISFFPVRKEWVSAVVTNFIGGLLFFWVDRIIFRQQYFFDVWGVEENVRCADCGEVCRGYRLVKSKGYDKTNDKNPKFRCEACSKKKYDSLQIAFDK